MDLIKPGVLCIGECMIEFSRRDDGTWTQGYAGDTLNVAWACRATLPPNAGAVDYLTRIGLDPFSDRMLEFLTISGIGTQYIQRDPHRNLGLYTIETDPEGERSFAYWRASSAARNLADDLNEVEPALKDSGLLYVSGITLAVLDSGPRSGFLDAIAEVRKSGLKVAFDPNIRPRLWSDKAEIHETVARMATISDVVLPTFDDEKAAFGDRTPVETIGRYRDLGCPEIIVKNGTSPTLCLSRGQSLEVSVPEAKRAVDTTGAGDSFNGAYLAKRMTGCSAQASIRAAQFASAAVVMHRGALIPQDELCAAADRNSAGN